RVAARESGLRLGEATTTFEIRPTDGEPIEDPESWVTRHMPPELRHYFFVSGERIEELTSPQSFDSVENGVRTLLDVEIFDRSVQHIRQYASRELGRRLRDSSQATQDEHLFDEEQSLVEQLDKVAAELAELRAADARLTHELNALQDQLRELRNIERVVARFEGVEARLADLDLERRHVADDIARLVGRSGHLLLASPAFSSVEERIAAVTRHADAELPVDAALID